MGKGKGLCGWACSWVLGVCAGVGKPSVHPDLAHHAVKTKYPPHTIHTPLPSPQPTPLDKQDPASTPHDPALHLFPLREPMTPFACARGSDSGSGGEEEAGWDVEERMHRVR